MVNLRICCVRGPSGKLPGTSLKRLDVGLLLKMKTSEFAWLLCPSVLLSPGTCPGSSVSSVTWGAEVRGAEGDKGRGRGRVPIPPAWGHIPPLPLGTLCAPCLGKWGRDAAASPQDRNTAPALSVEGELAVHLVRCKQRTAPKPSLGLRDALALTLTHQ